MPVSPNGGRGRDGMLEEHNVLQEDMHSFFSTDRLPSKSSDGKGSGGANAGGGDGGGGGGATSSSSSSATVATATTTAATTWPGLLRTVPWAQLLSLLLCCWGHVFLLRHHASCRLPLHAATS
ncbi:uncharacterized protein LOC143297136 [Babylonia areolata]|uniref:uncharacterized protein LOC143297136 n=1 Tax=Babylonia areolata TaxID=304850 RepID=UPI003FD4153A